jgi:hypothetical protein
MRGTRIEIGRNLCYKPNQQNNITTIAISKQTFSLLPIIEIRKAREDMLN